MCLESETVSLSRFGPEAAWRANLCLWTYRAKGRFLDFLFLNMASREM